MDGLVRLEQGIAREDFVDLERAGAEQARRADENREWALKAEKERDEAREKLENEMKWHHRTHRELIEAQCKLLDIEYDKLKS